VESLQGTGFLVEQLLPRLAAPVVSALIVTILWWLTGWTWFDLGPWPWVIGALPLAVLLGLRLHLAIAHHAATREASLAAVAALRDLGASLREAGGDPASVVGALRLLRHRFAPGALLTDLQAVLPESVLAQVRTARDPQQALLAACAQAAHDAGADLGIEPARRAVHGIQAGASGGAPLGVASELSLIYLVTLPVGLVTTTGNLTFLAVAGIGLAFLTLDALAAELERPPGPGPAWRGLEPVIRAAERELLPASEPAVEPALGPPSAPDPAASQPQASEPQASDGATVADS